MTKTPIFNVPDSSFKEPIEKVRKRTPSSTHLSRKKFTEDVDVDKEEPMVVVEKPIKISVRKPLPTLKSLSKENKKLQRLL